MKITQYAICQKGVVNILTPGREITPLDFVEILINEFGFNQVALTRRGEGTVLELGVGKLVYLSLVDTGSVELTDLWVFFRNLLGFTLEEGVTFSERSYQVRKVILDTLGLTGEEPQRQIHGMVYSMLFGKPLPKAELTLK